MICRCGGLAMGVLAAGAAQHVCGLCACNTTAFNATADDVDEMEPAAN